MSPSSTALSQYRRSGPSQATRTASAKDSGNSRPHLRHAAIWVWQMRNTSVRDTLPTGLHCVDMDRARAFFRAMGSVIVSRLCRYPVKGLSAKLLDALELRPGRTIAHDRRFAVAHGTAPLDPAARSEARRVGKECGGTCS